MKKPFPATFFAVLFAFACTQAPAADLFSYTALKLPYAPRTNGSWLKIIKTQEDWSAFYLNSIPADLNPASELWAVPVLDFANYQVVAGGLGGKTGVELTVQSVIEQTNDIYVSAISIHAGPKCSVATIVTYPHVVLLIKKSDKKITVFHSPTTLSACL